MRTLTLVSRIAALAIACALTIPSIAAAQTNKPSSAQPPAGTQSGIKIGDQVRARSGGLMMTVRDLKGPNAICEWQDENGALHTGPFPLNDLVAIGGPGTEAAPVTTETEPYHPCPAEVVTASGRHECIDAK